MTFKKNIAQTKPEKEKETKTLFRKFTPEKLLCFAVISWAFESAWILSAVAFD